MAINKKTLIAFTALLCLYLFGVYFAIKTTYDPDPIRYDSSLSEGIIFSTPGYPKFIEKTSGLSGIEKWGRWTNQNYGPCIFTFKTPLPKKFILQLSAVAFGPNNSAPTKIKIGDIESSVLINQPTPTTYTLELSNPKTLKTIEIIPPLPTSPFEIDPKSKDGRKLGIGLYTLKIVPIK